MNDADAALALWIQGREETVRALTCFNDFADMQRTLDGWGRLVDDFFVNRNELYDEFFSALRSTAFATAEDFFADCDAGFTFEGGEGDLLTIPGPLANDPICGPW